MFFDGWTGLLRVVLVGVPAYAGLILLLRITGKRTLSKMNAFDFVVTVALGSTLASILTSETLALAEGMLALAVLIALQFAISWSSIRSDSVENLIKAEPRVLLWRGELRRDALREERVTEAEVRVAMRKHGVPGSSRTAAVVLETDGTFTVVPDLGDGEPRALLGLSATPGGA